MARPKSKAALKRARLAEMQDEHLDCRDLGHRWETTDADEVKKGMVRREVRCPICTTERVDLFRLAAWGAKLIKRRYYYPEGFLKSGPKDAPKGIKLAKAEVRKEAILRIVKQKAKRTAGVRSK